MNYYDPKRFKRNEIYTLVISPRESGKTLFMINRNKNCRVIRKGKIMKELVLLNSDDGFMVQEVNGRSCKFSNRCFTYKDENNVYHLIDRESGLSIVKARVLKHLEELFNERKENYESFIKTDAYRIKVERFEKMKLVNNYQKGK